MDGSGLCPSTGPGAAFPQRLVLLSFPVPAVFLVWVAHEDQPPTGGVPFAHGHCRASSKVVKKTKACAQN